MLQFADLACVEEALGANSARGLPTVSDDLFGCQQLLAVVNPALLPQPCVSNNRAPNPADVAMPRFVTPTPVSNTPYQTLATESAIGELRAQCQTASLQPPLTPASSSQEAPSIIAQQPPCFLDSGSFDAGGTGAGLSTHVAGMNAAPAEMSGALLTVLRLYHFDSPGELATWEYNDKGHHPMHSLVVALCSSDFPRGHAAFLELNQAGRDRWVLELWMEAVKFTRRQYGECTPRTHTDLSPNNTPMMLLAKSRISVCSTQTLHSMLSFLVIDGVGKPNLVDNRGANAVMMAAGHGNKPVFDWFAKRAGHLAESGFQWFHHNIDGRNILDLAERHSEIHRLCLDLAESGFMQNNASEGANQRRRLSGNQVGNRYVPM